MSVNCIQHLNLFQFMPFSFHNKLKYNPAYLGGQMNKRVDGMISVLLQIEEDMFFRRQRKQLKWHTNPKLSKEQERHQKDLCIPPQHIPVR